MELISTNLIFDRATPPSTSLVFGSTILFIGLSGNSANAITSSIDLSILKSISSTSVVGDVGSITYTIGIDLLGNTSYISSNTLNIGTRSIFGIGYLQGNTGIVSSGILSIGKFEGSVINISGVSGYITSTSYSVSSDSYVSLSGTTAITTISNRFDDTLSLAGIPSHRAYISLNRDNIIEIAGYTYNNIFTAGNATPTYTIYSRYSISKGGKAVPSPSSRPYTNLLFKSKPREYKFSARLPNILYKKLDVRTYASYNKADVSSRPIFINKYYSHLRGGMVYYASIRYNIVYSENRNILIISDHNSISLVRHAGTTAIGSNSRTNSFNSPER